ncbi:MAG: DEAD/DEAH box helicase [Tenacibaculum sp.]
MSTFSELGLSEPISKALTDLGYKTPTLIQEKAILQIISSKQDLKAFAQTGTGKTAAFSLPIIELLNQNETNIQAIILSPTRELAIQIGSNIDEFLKYTSQIKAVTVYGGASIEQQIKQLKNGVQIVIGTPGRTVDLIKRKALKLNSIKWLVLDEADEMLNMGFKEELDCVLEASPQTKQILLFSATFPKEVEAIAANYMHNPIEISSGQKNQGADNVNHQYYLITEKTRYLALKRIADINPDIYAIVFCRTRRETQQIADYLIKDGYNADALHGDLSQIQRDIVMDKFRKKSIKILVATDVAARGLDVDNLSHVINHKLPDQIENYNHRSGRTGRAGNKGVSIVLINKREKSKLYPIERILNKKFVHSTIPSGREICEKQLFHLIEKVENTEVNESEIAAFLPLIYKKLENLSREELIQKFVSFEFNSFLSYYKNAPDLNNAISENSKVRLSNKNMTRFFINLGRKDKLNPAKLIGLINGQRVGIKAKIGAIDIFGNFSFFEIDKNFESELLYDFQQNKPSFNGRSVRIEISEIKNKESRKSQISYFKSYANYSNNNKDNLILTKRLGRKRIDAKSKRQSTGFGRKRRRD